MYIDNNFEEFLEDCVTKCNQVQVKEFKKSEIITTYIEKRNQVCIIMSGEADLIRYDFNGNKTIIKHLGKNDIFGETFYPTKTNNELFVLAKKKCKVLFFTYDFIFHKCKANCKFHSFLSENITHLILIQIISLNTRIEVLTQKLEINYYLILIFYHHNL